MQLAEALNEKGHVTAFAIGGSQIDTAKNFGVSKIYELTDICYLAESEWGLFESITERDYIEKCLSEEKDIIEQFRPDLIVSDFRLTAGISAQTQSIPWVSMLAQLWYLPGYRFLLQDVYRRSGLDEISAESIDLKFQQLAKKLNWLVKEIKMSEITDLMQLYISPYCILLRTIPSFIESITLPRNFNLVGPFFPRALNRQPIDEVIDKLKGHNIEIKPNKKIIILRFSGLIKDKTATDNFIEVLKDRFRNTEFQLIIGDTDSSTTCENVFVTSFIPFELIFQLNNTILISNGGLNTSSQAIAWEIPHLVAPTQVENEYNAFIIKKLSVGEVLFPLSKFEPEIVFKMINNLFDDEKYKIALREVKKYFQVYTGVTAAIKCLEEQRLIPR